MTKVMTLEQVYYEICECNDIVMGDKIKEFFGNDNDSFDSDFDTDKNKIWIVADGKDIEPSQEEIKAFCEYMSGE
jgi:hypothetical protein